MGETEAFRAADEILDPDHRLPGEEESEQSPLLDDAMHWERVYAELVGFKRDILEALESKQEETDRHAVVAEVANDRTLLEAELKRLVRRHHYWRQRVRELEPEATTGS